MDGPEDTVGGLGLQQAPVNVRECRPRCGPVEADNAATVRSPADREFHLVPVGEFRRRGDDLVGLRAAKASDPSEGVREKLPLP